MTGSDMKLYFNATPVSASGATAYGGVSWAEITVVRDVTMTGEWGTADASTRASRIRMEDVTLRDHGVEAEIKWSPDDDAFKALITAWRAGSEIAIACLDGDDGATGTQGIAGNFKVTGFTRDEPLEGLVVSNLVLRPSSFVDYFIVGSS